MCGIIGVTLAAGDAIRLLLGGLKRLEYRGYDSAGIAVVGKSGLSVIKEVGPVSDLIRKVSSSPISGRTGVGHTRWATHGGVSVTNAHPHVDCSGNLAVVHNGIIENYSELREVLISRGHTFRSETDTEVVAHMIEEELSAGNPPPEAVAKVASQLLGTFALAVVMAGSDSILLARRGSPLVIGVGDGEMYCASDIAAFIDRTRRIITMGDDEVAEISPGGVRMWDVSGGEMREVSRSPQVVEWAATEVSKGSLPHFMLKEIYEQPESVGRAVDQALTYSDRAVDEILRAVEGGRRIYFAAAGTSYHSSLVGKFLFSSLARVPSESVIASEFKEWALPSLSEGDVVFAISQSGETADVLTAVRAAKRSGARVISLVNVPASTLTRESHEVLYTAAGPEVGVAATKTYTAQVAVLSVLASKLAVSLGREVGRARSLLRAVREVPDVIRRQIGSWDEEASAASGKLKGARSVYFLGRGINVATSLEGALKLKEISYIHAEGFPGGEYKHGPLALISEGVPAVAVIPVDEGLRRLMVSNVMEVKARGALVISVGPGGAGDPSDLRIRVDLGGLPEEATPIVYAVPLQLLAYRTAVLLGRNPDRPRNLAKSVTVI